MNNSIITELGIIQQIEVDRMNLLYMEVDNSIENQQKAWPKFESNFPSLKGRKLLGLDYDAKNKYRLCSVVLEEDNGEMFGLENFNFDGGTYMRLRLKYEPPELYDKIGPAYSILMSKFEDRINWALPFIEQYKAKNILDIMIPIQQ